MNDVYLLTVFNAVNVPEEVKAQVMHLLAPFDPDIYSRVCDETGRAL